MLLFLLFSDYTGESTESVVNNIYSNGTSNNTKQQQHRQQQPQQQKKSQSLSSSSSTSSPSSPPRPLTSPSPLASLSPDSLPPLPLLFLNGSAPKLNSETINFLHRIYCKECRNMEEQRNNNNNNQKQQQQQQQQQQKSPVEELSISQSMDKNKECKYTNILSFD